VVEPDSIATPRRVSALLLAGTLLWIFATGIQTTYAYAAKSTQSQGTIVFGAFLTSAFELVVINAAFVERTIFAAPLSAIHPTIMFVWSGIRVLPSYSAIGAGAATLGLALAFVSGLNNMRTEAEDSAIHAFQAFLKTWVVHNSEELEKILAHYSLKEEIRTKIVRFNLPGTNPTMILSGIHPGPFYPVGSYNLPELFFDRFSAKGMSALVMHRPGGHERNLPSQSECALYAEEAAQFAQRVQTNSPAKIRGPVSTKMEESTATGIVLGNQALVIVSSSPLGSDDLAYSTEERLLPLAREYGLEVSIVDAHNSIGGERVRLTLTDEGGWRNLFEKLSTEEENEFRAGFAHSSEIEFRHGRDISEAGLGVLVFQIGNAKWALAFADSNNAISGSKEEVRRKLENVGLKLIELCTSDSHNLAARDFAIERGYFALGEATPISVVADTITKLGQIAMDRLSSCNYGIDEMVSSATIIGTKAIEDFSLLARRSSRFAKRYLSVAIPLFLGLLLLTVLD